MLKETYFVPLENNHNISGYDLCNSDLMYLMLVSTKQNHTTKYKSHLTKTEDKVVMNLIDNPVL